MNYIFREIVFWLRRVEQTYEWFSKLVDLYSREVQDLYWRYTAFINRLITDYNAKSSGIIFVDGGLCAPSTLMRALECGCAHTKHVSVTVYTKYFLWLCDGEYTFVETSQRKGKTEKQRKNSYQIKSPRYSFASLVFASIFHSAFSENVGSCKVLLRYILL